MIRTAKSVLPALTRHASAKSAAPAIVVVDSVRIPFKTSGTDYNDLMAYDLMRMSLKGLVDKTAISYDDVDYVLCGNVVQEGAWCVCVCACVCGGCVQGVGMRIPLAGI